MRSTPTNERRKRRDFKSKALKCFSAKASKGLEKKQHSPKQQQQKNGASTYGPSKIGSAAVVNPAASPAPSSKLCSPVSSAMPLPSDTSDSVPKPATNPNPSKTDSVGFRGMDARSRDAKGIPIIPGLSDVGMHTFDMLWQSAHEFDLDSACARLEGMLELIQHHPALSPEVAALRRLVEAWWDLIPTRETRRPALFEERLEHGRSLSLEDAVNYLLRIRVGFARNTRLTHECALIDQLFNAWTELHNNQVSERARRL